MNAKVKPKEYTVLSILNWKFIINLHPRQIWYASAEKNKVRLERDNVTINMSNEEFEKYFKVVENV